MKSFDPDLLDRTDPLACFRAKFASLPEGLIYLDGNSLGRLPLSTPVALANAMEDQWGRRLIRSWNEGWLDAPLRIGDKIGRLIGAGPGQVAVCDSTSVNLYKLAWAALDLRPGRTKILSDRFNFPSDLYILEGIAAQRGLRLELLASPDDIGMEQHDVLEAIDADTALVVLSLVVFKSGYRYDAATISRQAGEMGAFVLWDLSHAAGAVPVELDAWGADMAIGCSYKYLNGGPGAPAYLYLRRGLQEEARSPIQGWFGQQNAFAFDLAYAPDRGIRRFLAGTPPVLSLLAIEPGVDLLLEAGMEAVYAKAVALGEYLIALYDERLVEMGYRLGSPRHAGQRGAHISLRHPEGYSINRTLIDELGVVPDFREPDNIRLGLAPLYTTFSEVRQAVECLRAVVVEKRYEKYPPDRLAVT